MPGIRLCCSFALGYIVTCGANKVLRGPSAKGAVPVDCGIDDKGGHRLALLTSSGFGTWDENTFVPSASMVAALRSLVLQLPASKRTQKDIQLASAKTDPSLDFFEPELYGKLNVVVVDDPCFLKDSFWRDADPSGTGVGLNYRLANVTKTTPQEIAPYAGRLDGGWCANFKSDKPGYLPSFGFSADRIRHVNIFDTLASREFKEDVFRMVATGKPISRSKNSTQATATEPEVEELKGLFDAADLVVVNGGNPDFAAFVLGIFANDIVDRAISRVRTGSAIYVGESAGSMAGSADIGLTYETKGNILSHLLRGSTAGLRIAGKCAIRPHDHDSKWDIAGSVYGLLKGLTVVRVPNGDALRCIGKHCVLAGSAPRPPSVFDNPDDAHLERIAAAFRP